MESEDTDEKKQERSINEVQVEGSNIKEQEGNETVLEGHKFQVESEPSTSKNEDEVSFVSIEDEAENTNTDTNELEKKEEGTILQEFSQQDMDSDLHMPGPLPYVLNQGMEEMKELEEIFQSTADTNELEKVEKVTILQENSPQLIDNDDLHMPGPSPYVLNQGMEEFEKLEEIFQSTSDTNELEKKEKGTINILQENSSDVLGSDDLNIQGPSPYVLNQQWEEFKKQEEIFQSTAAQKMMETVFGQVMNNLQSAAEIQSKGPPLQEERIRKLSERVVECERRLKAIERHLRESKREKHHLLQEIDCLEKRIIEKLKTDLVERIASSTTPCEYDLALLDLLNQHIRDHHKRSKAIGEIETKNRAMERVMNNADDILMKSKWFRGGLINLPKEPEKNLRFNKYHKEVSFRKVDAPIGISESKQSLTVLKDFKEDSQLSFMVVEQLRKQEEAIPRSLSDLSIEALEVLTTVELSEGNDNAEKNEEDSDSISQKSTE